MLETFYSTGMRLGELAGMDLGDLDLLDGQVRVVGKGRKERIVPLGLALYWCSGGTWRSGRTSSRTP